MEVRLPNLGEGADSGTVVSVLVKAGAPVKKGQNIIELETGKAVAPIPSPAEGRVGRVAVKEGDRLNVGQLILELESSSGATSEDGAAPASASTKSGSTPVPSSPSVPTATATTPARARVAAAGAAVPATHSAGVPVTQPLTASLPAVVATAADLVAEGEPEVEPILDENPGAGPNVRRIARDLGLDLRVIAGTGKSGQITIDDLKGYIANLRNRALRPRVVATPIAVPVVTTPAPAAAAKAVIPLPDFTRWGTVQRKPISPLRRTIAERMVASATTLPTVTQFDEADVTRLNEIRKAHASAYEAKGARLTLTSFILKVVASTLRKHPVLNASFDEAAGEIVFKDYVHLGLAVDTEAGLLVPVLRDADRKSLLELSLAVQDLAAKARDRKLALADMQGGTFTLSNQGGLGGAHFTPIINLPEVAILGLGRSALKPAVVDGKIEPRLLLPLALTYDHRLIDGGVAARFTTDLVAGLQSFSEAEVKL